MNELPNKLNDKLKIRLNFNALRQLGKQNNLVDFSSNDYLGFSKSDTIFKNTHQYLIDNDLLINGATGSRLLSGNHSLYKEVEDYLSDFHNSDSALIFNSGYDANLGFFASVPQRGDIILYDEFIHASIRDGITMSYANAYKFKHNNLENLQTKLSIRTQSKSRESDIYIVTESVFSMDGDSPDLIKLSNICKTNKAYLIVDEAHALGVFGEHGCGLIQHHQLENEIFARIITFGKGLGCHGAAILGNSSLKQYLVNFARSLIYTTGLPPHSLATIQSAYKQLVISNDSEKSHSPIEKLTTNIQFFKAEINKLNLPIFPFKELSEGQWGFIKSDSAIQSCIISGNEKAKRLAALLQNNGFDVKPILSPTVPEGQERLRFCLHCYNSNKEITEVLTLLATFVKEIN